LLLPQDALTTHVIIDDEVIQYTGISGDDITGCVRGALGTIAASHDDESDFETVYRLNDNAIDLALKIMMSGGDEFYRDSIQVLEFEASTKRIYYKNNNIQNDLGLVAGDLITVEGAVNGSNNLVNGVISGFGVLSTRSYIEVLDTLVDETVIGSVVSKFKSKYNALNFGLGMSPELVDVAEHEKLNDFFGASFVDYDFRLKDEVNGKDFIEKEIYFPSGMYSIPRKGKSSLGITLPPIGDENTFQLDKTNIKKPNVLNIPRSINKDFYNSVIYKYHEDIVRDKFLRSNKRLDADSISRIKTGLRPFIVESKGMRDNPATKSLIEVQSRRFVDRYKFAAQRISVECFYGIGFKIEVGDTVLLDGDELNIYNIETGRNDLDAKIFEVVNKSLNIKTGNVKLELLDTAFSTDGRFVTIGPSSNIANGSTTTKIILKNSQGLAVTAKERDKWERFIGEQVEVHSPSYAQREHVTLESFDPQNDSAIIVSTLSFTPSDGFVLNMPTYQNASNKWKVSHGFLCPSIQVVSGISNTSFTVNAPDVADLFEGAIIRLHNEDYSTRSVETKIDTIVSTTITTVDDLGFTPDSTFKIELVGFASDNGLPYRIL
jgi:hypothetical protein